MGNSTDPFDEALYVYCARLACSHAYEVADRLIRKGLKHDLIRPLFSLLGPRETRALKLQFILPSGEAGSPGLLPRFEIDSCTMIWPSRTGPQLARSW